MLITKTSNSEQSQNKWEVRKVTGEKIQNLYRTQSFFYTTVCFLLKEVLRKFTAAEEEEINITVSAGRC